MLHSVMTPSSLWDGGVHGTQQLHTYHVCNCYDYYMSVSGSPLSVCIFQLQEIGSDLYLIHIKVAPWKLLINGGRNLKARPGTISVTLIENAKCVIR